MSDTVLATWVGPFEAKLPDGTILEPGVTELEIGVDEARDSDHWQTKTAPRTSPQPAAAGAVGRREPAASPSDDKAGE